MKDTTIYLQDLPVFMWPPLFCPLNLTSSESDESAENNPIRKEGCRMKKILCIVLSAALIVLPVVMLIRKRHMA